MKVFIIEFDVNKSFVDSWRIHTINHTYNKSNFLDGQEAFYLKWHCLFNTNKTNMQEWYWRYMDFISLSGIECGSNYPKRFIRLVITRPLWVYNDNDCIITLAFSKTKCNFFLNLLTVLTLIKWSRIKGHILIFTYILLNIWILYTTILPN